MSALSIQPTFPIFTETDGLPLENGYIWLGTANLDPQGNPINVYWDAALTIPAGQPIRTLNGYPSRNGTPARLYVNSDYSIRVQDSKGSLVYSAPAATERYGNVITLADLDFIAAGVGAVVRNAQDKMRDFINAKDFGAVGDGIVNDTTALQNACAACLAQNKALYVPAGTYKLSGKIQVPRGLVGAGSGVTFFQGVNAGVKSGNLMEFTGPGTYQGFTIDGAVSADPVSWNSSNYDSFTGWNNIYIISDDVVSIDIFSRNSAQAGFAVYGQNRILFINCRTQRTRNNFGDGFFNYVCRDITYINCRAYDYTRIGFVFDGDTSIALANRCSYIDCYAEFGHDSSVLYGGFEYNTGYWCENHDNVRYENCTAVNNTYSGFVVASAVGAARTGYFGNCHAAQSPQGYLLGAFATFPNYLSVIMDACTFDASGVTVGEIYSIGNNTSAVLNACSAKLNSGGSQTRVIGVGPNSRVVVNNFIENWTNKPLADLYNTASAVASVGGFPGSGIIPASVEVNGYVTLTTLEPCTVKWIGTPVGGGLSLRNGIYDIPFFGTNGGALIENATINRYGTTSQIIGSMSRVLFSNCSIANSVFIGWDDALDQTVFDDCNFTRSIAQPNVTFYRLSGTSYKPSRLKFLNSTFSSNLETLDYYVRQNADPAVFNNVGQNIVLTGTVFHNTGGATANFAIRQEATSGAASRAYVGSSWKSSTITNVATYLNAGAVINDL